MTSLALFPVPQTDPSDAGRTDPRRSRARRSDATRVSQRPGPFQAVDIRARRNVATGDAAQRCRLHPRTGRDRARSPLDELDKISDPTQLIELLKGVKGVLGVKNTHFILTVSEDATALFNDRYTGRRNLLESSFDEIVHLDRVSLELATRIVNDSLSALADVEHSRRPDLSALAWIFGAGIPREIKRCALRWFAESGGQQPVSAFHIWKSIFLDVLVNISTALPVAKGGDLEPRPLEGTPTTRQPSVAG
jgi:hypothetical protein